MFRELFDRAPDAMIVVDREGRVVRANPQAQRMFGFAEDELRGRPIEILMPERVRHAHHGHREGYVANPHVRPMGTGQELTGLKRNGKQFPVEIALSPLNTAEGQLFLASIRDISETQRARQAVARARYDAVIAEFGRVALASPDVEGALGPAPELVAGALRADAVAIIFRHPQLGQAQVRTAFGVRPEALAGLNWTTLAPEDKREALAKMEAPLVLHGEAALIDAGFAAAVVVPLVDRAEPLGAMLVMTRGAPQFDQDALHFMHAVANLLASAVQRARTEEQLSHAQRLEAIGQLTGGVAHDFNNLLTVVSGNLQILDDELADRPAAREIIGSALRAVGRGAELTRKLLAFAGRQRLAPRVCDSAKLLDELGSMLRRTLGETVSLRISYPPDIAPVFADAGQLDNALVNLALNARDAMPRGGHLIISATHKHVDAGGAPDAPAEGDYVAFTVRDTGLGMTPEVLARAFEPFFTTKDHGKGSGLGLSMVYGFVKQSGGHLTVDSQLGYGTRIDLCLPVADRRDAQDGNEATTVARGSETILVVEDEADVRDIAIAFLRSLGYSVLSAHDANEALALVARHADIALVFSDVVLGTGMTGVELAESVRRSRPQLPVLLTSGYEHSAFGARGAGEDLAVLRKPYRREELAAAVRAKLDAR